MMRRSKYNAIPTEVDGIHFASKREAARYRELMMLQAANEISNLRVHPRYEIAPAVTFNDGFNESRARTRYYEADFEYLDHRTGHRVVEDVKSPATAREPLYRLKTHLFLAIYGYIYQFRETMPSPRGRPTKKEGEG